MNDPFNRRSTASTSGSAGRGADPLADPLAELARIVGAPDPFENLFEDARTVKKEGTREEASARGHGRGEPQLHLPRAVGLRGSLDHDEASRPLPHVEDAPPLRTTPHDSYDAHDEDGYYDTYSPVEDDYAPPHRLERRPRRFGGGFMAVGIVAFAVFGGGIGYAWKSGLLDSSSLAGAKSDVPVILASDKPTKVKPAAAPGQEEVASTKEIFERVGQMKTDTPETVVPREELPVSIENPPADAAPPETDSALGTASPAKSGVRIASAEPLPPGSLSPEPRRVRTVKVLSDGTVVTGVASAPPLVSGGQPGESEADQSSVAAASAEEAQEPAEGDGGIEGSTVIGSLAAGAEDAAPDALAGSADTEAPDLESAETGPTALPPRRPRSIPANPSPERSVTAEGARPAGTQVASLEAPSSAARPAAQGAGFAVQISSQKTEGDALSSYRSMQRKFPTVFAGANATIRRADLGEKGTFYRVRVGNWSREGATSFCSKLKAAGGDCVVARY
jgi:hypothetical protein